MRKKTTFKWYCSSLQVEVSIAPCGVHTADEEETEEEDEEEGEEVVR